MHYNMIVKGQVWELSLNPSFVKEKSLKYV